MRKNGRGWNRLRPLRLELGAVPYAEGSCLISTGETRVLCAASVAGEVPTWREGSGRGWVTGEYAMLPRSTHTRRGRERAGPGGRTQEIQRLIGRSLRSVVDLEALGERTVTLDCDVLQADGGTRTAAVTGAWIALALACDHLVAAGALARTPVREGVAAVSVGMLEEEPLLDLDYPEDRDAGVDFNVVATADGRLVEVQGTAEGLPFGRDTLDRLVDLALEGIAELSRGQQEALARVRAEPGAKGGA